MDSPKVGPTASPQPALVASPSSRQGVSTKGFDQAQGCKCQRCGEHYRVDLLVPDDLWEKIKPRHKPPGAGLFCGLCIFACLEARGDFAAYRMEEVP